MNLKALIAKDLDGLFFKNAEEYCEELHICVDSKREYVIFGSMQSNMVDNNNFSNSAPLQAVSWTLYCPYPIGGELYVDSGATLYINKTPYTVVDVSDEMGGATILLKAGTSYYGGGD